MKFAWWNRKVEERGVRRLKKDAVLFETFNSANSLNLLRSLARPSLATQKARSSLGNFVAKSRLLKLPPGRFSQTPYPSFFIFFFFLLLSCEKAKPAVEYMPDMADQVAIKAQEEMRAPPAGTIPQGYNPYTYMEDPEAAGRELKNPLTPTIEVLQAGKANFETFCAVCHGTRGLGDGTIVPKFPQPPSLVSEKVTHWADGRIYHVITMGQNLMPSYATQVAPEDRWAIIHYLRVLQKSANPTEEDVKKARELEKN